MEFTREQMQFRSRRSLYHRQLNGDFILCKGNRPSVGILEAQVIESFAMFFSKQNNSIFLKLACISLCIPAFQNDNRLYRHTNENRKIKNVFVLCIQNLTSFFFVNKVYEPAFVFYRLLTLLEQTLLQKRLHPQACVSLLHIHKAKYELGNTAEQLILCER